MDVALFGGSFDPPHVGHVLAVAYVLATGGFDRVLVVPVFAHAFDKELSPFEHRVQMALLAFAEMPKVTVSTVEAELGTPSRTLRTIQHLQKEHPDFRLRLVVGADVLEAKDQWFGFDEVARLAPLLVLGRAGISHPDAPQAMLPDVSSTGVRALLRGVPGPRAASDELRRVVPLRVLHYIDQHGLYR